MKTRYLIVVWLCLCVTLSVTAQQKLTKVSKTINVTKDVSIDLNTSYVQIEIDTWNRNSLEVEAYIEGEKLSKEELEEALKHWNLKVEGSGSNVSITSRGGAHHGSWDDLAEVHVALESLESLKALEVLGDINFADMPEMPEMPEMPVVPEIAHIDIPEMPEVPELPELPEGVNNVSFDTEAYNKEGEAYLERWSREYEKKYGKEYKEKMKAWGREMAKVDFSTYEQKMEVWGEQFGKKFGEEYAEQMEAWGNEFAEKFDEEWSKKMEAWGEKYGEKMEKRGKELEKRLAKREKEMAKRQERLAQRMEERQEAHEKRRESIARRYEARSHKVKKTIKIKMPKDAKLNMNVRHGELKMSSVINNLKADISHATLVANHIDGSETSINVSYSPVDVVLWNNGELNLKYVDDAHVNTVNSIRLNSNSSDIHISDFIGNAIIDGSFGDLVISEIADSFTNLNVILENSDAVLKLPDSDYSLYFKGNRSRLNDEMTSQKTIENYPNKDAIKRTIVLNTKFSDVVLKE